MMLRYSGGSLASALLLHGGSVTWLSPRYNRTANLEPLEFRIMDSSKDRECLRVFREYQAALDQLHTIQTAIDTALQAGAEVTEGQWSAEAKARQRVVETRDRFDAFREDSTVPSWAAADDEASIVRG
jgi:hypothetical protein